MGSTRSKVHGSHLSWSKLASDQHMIHQCRTGPLGSWCHRRHTLHSINVSNYCFVEGSFPPHVTVESEAPIALEQLKEKGGTNSLSCHSDEKLSGASLLEGLQKSRSLEGCEQLGLFCLHAASFVGKEGSQPQQHLWQRGPRRNKRARASSKSKGGI